MKKVYGAGYAGMILLAVILMGFEWGTPKKTTQAKASSSSPPAAKQSMDVAQMPVPQMMTILSQNMTLWPVLSSVQKTQAIETAIAYYRNNLNSAILRPADFYVQQVDQSFAGNPQLQSTDILTFMKLLAVMEYDFYNGQDKDELAKQTLGEEMYRNLKASRG